MLAEEVRTFRRQRALERARKLADEYWLDQVKRTRSIAFLVLSQPTEKVRIVADDSPESRK